MALARAFLLFGATAACEIAGCYLVYLWLRRAGPVWLLLPAALALAVFAWLLTLHPTAAARVYAAYGGVYIGASLLWLRYVEGVRLTPWDFAGAVLCLLGAGVIVWGTQPPA